jgi:hypothetical protein
MVHAPGVDRQVQIQNLGPGPVLIGHIQTAGANVDDFTPGGQDCAQTLAAGMSCTTDVIFSPTALGPRSAVLEVFTDAAPPISVSLSGNGTAGGTVPTITCPSNITVTAGAGQTTASVGIGMATATGDGVLVTAIRSDGGALGAPYPVGTTIVTWTATDRSLNQAACTQSVTVQAASQSLSISCPPNQTVVVQGSDTSAQVMPGLATSAGAGLTIVGVRSDGKALVDPYPIGTLTITWTATDSSGNEGTCTQTISVGSGSVAPSNPSSLIDPSSASPHVDGVTPAQGPLYQRAIVHGSGFADVQGTSYVTVGGRRVTVLAWSAAAIGIVLNPLAFNPSPLAINAAYPLQVVTPASGQRSNTVSFFLTDGAPAGTPGSPATGPSEQPHFGSFQQQLFCPGDTVVVLGAGFGQTQGTGFVAVTVPLADPSGSVVHQIFALPVLSWLENAISFALNLPSGAIPGTYTTTVHRSNGKTTSGIFTVGARNASGDCLAVN